MPIEIERRFLVRRDLLPPLPRNGRRLTQGYLSFAPLVRVRVAAASGRSRAQGFLTIKGRGTRVRAEFEYPIPAREARELLAFCGAFVLEKVRYRIGPWEVDGYLGRHAGLWLAEIELARADAPLPDPLPPWLGREITGDPRYTNAMLARLKRWPPRWAARNG